MVKLANSLYIFMNLKWYIIFRSFHARYTAMMGGTGIPPHVHEQILQNYHQHINRHNNNNNGSSENNIGGHMNNINNNNLNNNNNSNSQNNSYRSMNGTANHNGDEYANLMSNRDKQWLIGIQLSQLNTGTPYIDDFYYTVFKERRAKVKGIKENKAHKDNQLNHPLIQPKGHAQLVLISMGNKNGTNQSRHQRERNNSETNAKEEKAPRTYTPLQFENSLGKLQCGSVTAPRKIIDMDIVGTDTGSPANSNAEITSQRKSRQVLLHIETLYRVALALEDLDNPTAIATAQIVRERKEKERQLAAEQELNKDENSLETMALGARAAQPIVAEKEETRDDLLTKLLAGLTHDKIVNMMAIRKGKVSRIYFSAF